MLKRPKTGQQICRDCFFYIFETEVHNTITQSSLFNPGDRVAIGASGGKGTKDSSFSSCYAGFTLGFPMSADSTVLAYIMKTLNERYQYGLELFLLSIDEGITGYRDDSLEVGQSYLFGYKHQGCSYPSKFYPTDCKKKSTAV